MKRLLVAAIALLLAAPLYSGSQATVRKAAVSTVSPVATRIGVEVLRRGGNAMDAAVAISFALAVSHPQSSILGGGGFLLYYDAKSKSVWALDFREVSPIEFKRAHFVDAAGNEKKDVATAGALSVAVPGGVAGLAEAHRRFGRGVWQSLLEPAVTLANEGIIVDPRLYADLEAENAARKIDRFRSTSDIFYPAGKAIAIGKRLRQPALAETIDRIGETNGTDFYRGTTARKIVAAMAQAGGIINPRDLEDYKTVWRAPIRIDYRAYRVFTAPPPSDGGVMLAEMLAILNPWDFSKLDAGGAPAIHLMAEASRRAFIDRNEHAGDPAFARITLQELLSEERIGRWRKSIDVTRATPTLQARTALRDPGETTHISVVDDEGNAVSMTMSLTDRFGSGIVVPGCGFFLNNAMSATSLLPSRPDRDGLMQPVVNTPDPRKRIASAMTPTIVLDGERLFMVLGTRGGPAIPTTILQVFMNVAAHGMSLADAVAAPRFHHQSTPDEIRCERGRAATELLQQLNALGHGVREDDPMGDVHAILVRDGTITAVADPRDGGAAGGY